LAQSQFDKTTLLLNIECQVTFALSCIRSAYKIKENFHLFVDRCVVGFTYRPISALVSTERGLLFCKLQRLDTSCSINCTYSIFVERDPDFCVK